MSASIVCGLPLNPSFIRMELETQAFFAMARVPMPGGKRGDPRTELREQLKDGQGFVVGYCTHSLQQIACVASVLAPFFARSKYRNVSSVPHGNACYAGYQQMYVGIILGKHILS